MRLYVNTGAGLRMAVPTGTEHGTHPPFKAQLFGHGAPHRYPLKNGAYLYGQHPGGRGGVSIQTRKLEATLATRAEMLAEASPFIAQVLNRIHGYSITNEHYAEIVEWVVFLDINRGLAKQTAGKYADYVAKFVETVVVDGKDLGALTRGDVENWQQHLYTRNQQKAETRSLKLTALRQFFDWRVGQGRGVNPTAGVKGPKKTDHAPRKFTDAQIRRLMDTCNLKTTIGIRDYAILMLVFTTGARRGDIATVDVTSFGMKQRLGAVRYHGKGGKVRVLSYGQATVDALKAWLSARSSIPLVDVDAMFVATGRGKTGTRMSDSAVYGVIVRALKKANIIAERGMALHSLRSAFATAMYDLGYKIEEIAIMMGHKSPETTRQYIVISNKHAKSRMPDRHVERVTGNRLRSQS